MKIKFLGHSAFFVEGSVSVVCDPYSGMDFEMEKVKADYCICSHDHFDHNAVNKVSASLYFYGLTSDVNPMIEKDISLKRIICCHDDENGAKRGKNSVIKFTVDGVRFCHYGDIGENFSEETAAKIGKCDVCFIPVGGFYTIDAEEAYKYACASKAKIVIPMHFKTPRSFDVLDTADKFIEKFERVKRGSELELTSSSLPQKTEVFVFDYEKY